MKPRHEQEKVGAELRGTESLGVELVTFVPKHFQVCVEGRGKERTD